MRKITILLACLLVLSCQKIVLDEPEGFAKVEMRGMYKAISPEGVVLRIRIVENLPSKGVDFWGEALTFQLKKEGYGSSTEGVFFDGLDKKGYYHEWGMAYGTETYKYLTAIIPYEQSIVITEVAGEYRAYADYRESIIDCLKTIKLE